MHVHHTPGIITICNANTTIGYCRYDATGEIEYLFVNAGYRRRGYATRLLDLVAAHVGGRLRFQAPFSPSGLHLIASYGRANARQRASRDVAAAIHVQGAPGDVAAIEQIIDRA